MSYQFEAPAIYSDEHLDHQPAFRDRVHAILRHCSDLTYVGWHAGHSFFDFYLPLIGELHVIEIWRPNAEALKMHFPQLSVHCEDVRQFMRLLPHIHDCLLWQQGPEHMEKSEAVELIRQMQLHFTTIILETPNGWRRQNSEGENPYEEHRSAWDKQDFEDLGFACITFMGPEHSLALLALWEKRVPSHK